MMRPLFRPGLTLADVVEHVAWEFEVEPATILAGGRQRRWLRIARDAVIWLADIHFCPTRRYQAQLAGALGICRKSLDGSRDRTRAALAVSPDQRALFGRLHDLLGRSSS